MPALPPVANVVKTVVAGTYGLYKWANILHWLFTGSVPGVSDLVAWNNRIATNWSTDMAPEQISSCSVTHITSTDLTSSMGAQDELLTGIPGTRGDDEIPANAAVLVVYPSDRRYRGGHWRSYLVAGGNADFRDSGSWSTAFTAEVQAHFRSFLTATIPFTSSATTFVDLVGVSYIDKALNPVPPYRRTTPLVQILPITEAFTVQEMASQRRRIGRK